jgi:peptidoglycan/LPS O-acetylase OafA/YrhL
LSSGAAQLVVLCLYLALPAAFGAHAVIWPLLGKLSALLVGILLYQIFNGQQSPLVAVLESSPFRYVGRISYGAYLVHHFVHFSWIEDILRNFSISISAPRPAQVLIELAISLALAATSWRYFERPIIAWAKRATSRRPGPLAAAVAPSQRAAGPP